MNRPVHVLQEGSDVRDVVYMTAIAVVDALENDPSGDPAEVSGHVGSLEEAGQLA